MNNISSTQLSMLDIGISNGSVETRLYSYESFRSNYDSFFIIIMQIPASASSDVDFSFSSTHIHLGENIGCSGSITFGSPFFNKCETGKRVANAIYL